jgi:hypothetical protein
MARNCLSTLSSANSFMCNMSSRSQRCSRQCQIRHDKCQIRHDSHLKSAPLYVVCIHWSNIAMLFKLSRSVVLTVVSEGYVFVGCNPVLLGEDLIVLGTYRHHINLIELPDNRLLRRHLPNDLPTRFLV